VVTVVVSDDRTAVVIGYDMVSPLGTELQSQWERAEAGQSGIGVLTRFQPSLEFPVFFAGQVADINTAEYDFLKPRPMAHWSSPIFKYALLVVHRALKNSGIEIDKALSPRTAVTMSSAIGGLDAIIQADRRMVREKRLPLPFVNPNACINMVGGKVAIFTNATGPIASTITACATGATSLITGAMLLTSGRAEVAICGAVDFPLVEPLVAGFYTMNCLHYQKDREAESPQRASRPFSVDRKGFVVSEGAGALIIATRQFARAHGIPYEIEIAGFSMTADAHHVVIPHLPTVTRCIAEAIQDAELEPADIDAVNAHAASTKVGDQVEFEALKNVFGSRIPPVTANKSLTGHAMGASSAIESIFSIKGMLENVLPPTINYNPDPELVLDCVPNQSRTVEQRTVLMNAFGFGGCNACIVFRRRG
jgi:3-oxoacyl-[acyl-carrier-protein] synthase II